MPGLHLVADAQHERDRGAVVEEPYRGTIGADRLDRRAGRRMGMSYRRAWLLVKLMNARFREPLVDATKGGLRGGGTVLTATGCEALARYRAMEAHAAEEIAAEVQEFFKLMTDRSPED